MVADPEIQDVCPIKRLNRSSGNSSAVAVQASFASHASLNLKCDFADFDVRESSVAVVFVQDCRRVLHYPENVDNDKHRRAI